MAQTSMTGGSALPGAPEPDVEAPDHDVRAVLAITPFRRLWLALGLSSFGDWLGLLATTSLAGALAGGTSSQLLAVSGVFILRLAPAVLFGPIAGVVADRLNRRWTLVYGDVLRFVLFCTIPIVGRLWWLFVATILIEIVGLFWMPAKEATMPNLVPRNRLEAANQLSLAVTYGSAPLAAVAFSALTLLNGVLDGFVPPLAGHPTYLALYVNALTFLVSAAVIWRLDFPPPSPTRHEKSVWHTAVEGWRYVGATPLVRGLVVGMLGAFAAGGVVIGLGQAFVADLDAGSPGYGTLFAAVFVGLALGMWLGPRLLSEFSRRRLFGLAIAAAGGWLVLLSLVPNIVMAVFLTVGLGACAGVAWVTGYTLLGLEVGDEVRGRTFAFVQSMVRIVLVSVLALAPAIAALFSKALSLPHTVRVNEYVSLTYTGVMATFLLAGVAAIGVGILSYRQMDDRPQASLRADLVAAVRARHINDAPARRRRGSGVFVAFEGGDGAGKSTQVRLLGDWLTAQGFEAVLTREPGATPAGARLRELLLAGTPLEPRAEALLFAADRAQHVDTVVNPALERAAVVVTDRYVDSSVAYQGTGRDLGVAEVSQLSRWATQGLTPDLTVLLDIPAGAGRGRREGEHDRLEAEPDDFHSRVRERFLELARSAPSRYLVLDATLPLQAIHAAVVERLTAVLPESPVDRAERERREAAAAAEAEQQRLEAEHQREEAERARLRDERREQERLATELAEAVVAERERLDAERVAALRAEADRVAAEQAEAQRLVAERTEAARVEVERREAARLAAEQQEAERLESARALAEQARIDAAAAAAAPTTRIPVVPPTAPMTTPGADDPTVVISTRRDTGPHGASLRDDIFGRDISGDDEQR